MRKQNAVTGDEMDIFHEHLTKVFSILKAGKTFTESGPSDDNGFFHERRGVLMNDMSTEDLKFMKDSLPGVNFQASPDKDDVNFKHDKVEIYFSSKKETFANHMKSVLRDPKSAAAATVGGLHAAVLTGLAVVAAPVITAAAAGTAVAATLAYLSMGDKIRDVFNGDEREEMLKIAAENLVNNSDNFRITSYSAYENRINEVKRLTDSFKNKRSENEYPKP